MDTTTRQFPSLQNVRRDWEIFLEALYSILDFGADESSPTTYTPDDFDADEGDLLEEFANKSTE